MDSDLLSRFGQVSRSEAMRMLQFLDNIRNEGSTGEELVEKLAVEDELGQSETTQGPREGRGNGSSQDRDGNNAGRIVDVRLAQTLFFILILGRLNQLVMSLHFPRILVFKDCALVYGQFYKEMY